MIRYWSFLSVFFTVGLLVPSLAARDRIDLCQEAVQQNNNDFWGKHLVVLTGQLDKRAGDKFDSRLLTVDRVLFGNAPYKHADQCIVTVNCNSDEYLTGHGKYLLLFQRLDDGKLLLSDDNIQQLGPALNYLELRSFDDPIISDAQMVVDILSIPDDSIRLKRMTAIWPQLKYRPFIKECFIRAMASQYRKTERNYNYAIEAIFREPEKYHSSTVLFADQLRRGANPMHAVPSLRKWPVTNEQYDLLEKLAAELPASDPNRAYFRVARSVNVEEIQRPLEPADKKRFRDAYAPDVWPIAAVVDFPNVEEKATRCTVNIERVISGEQVLAPGKQEILLQRGVPLPPAGKHLVFFSWSVDDEGREIACYGNYILIIGSVINYHPVVSVDDPAVDDLRSLILFTRERDIALWQPLRIDTIDVKQHPLLKNFNLRQAALQAATLEKTFDQYSMEILSHPQDNSLQFLVLTDRLFTSPSWTNDPISDTAHKWKLSQERQALFLELQRQLTPADDDEPYYSSLYINNVLKEFEHTR